MVLHLLPYKCSFCATLWKQQPYEYSDWVDQNIIGRYAPKFMVCFLYLLNSTCTMHVKIIFLKKLLSCIDKGLIAWFKMQPELIILAG